MYCHKEILSRLEKNVKANYQHQVLDKGREDYGAFIVGHDYGFAVADHCTNADALAQAVCCLLAEESKLYLDEELFERVQASMTYQVNALRDSGLIDLPKVNMNTPNDTGFVVQLLSPLCKWARQLADNREDAKLAEFATAVDKGLGEFIKRGTKGMIDKGFRTPNHRWVISSALAQGMELFPEIEGQDYLESILAETADINADGEWSERSTGVYSAVCNRSWYLLAKTLKRPEYLNHVRADLDFMATLINPDGSVVTSISHRQDQGNKVIPITIAESYFSMGMEDKNGLYLAIADKLVEASSSGITWLYYPFIEHPEYKAKQAKRTPIPTEVDKFFPASKFWRVSKNEMSATVCAENNNAFGLKFGDVNLKALRIKGTYLNVANFSADKIERTVTGVKLTHSTSANEQPSWDLPLGRPVEFDNPHTGFYPLSTKGIRDKYMLEPLDIHLTIEQLENGFDLQLTTDGGYDKTPFIIEMFFDSDCCLDINGVMTSPKEGTEFLMESGKATIHSRQYGISVAGGGMAHRMTDMLQTPKVPGCFRIFCAYLTPLDEKLKIRYGLWSEAKGI